jgi:hypothetical protein
MIAHPITDRIDHALARIAECNSERGRTVRGIYLTERDMVELGETSYRGHKVVLARNGAHSSLVYNKCGQAFTVPRTLPTP